MTITTTYQIERLRAEAGEAGDVAQVAICDRALRGSQRAIRACERIIRETRDEAAYQARIESLEPRS